LFLSEEGGLSLGDLAFAFQIAFVADKDNGYFFIGVVSHFLKPLANRFKCRTA